MTGHLRVSPGPGRQGLNLWLSFLRVQLYSFHPERVLFRPGCVNLRSRLCGVPVYASAQSLDFLARTKNPRFPNWKAVVSIRIGNQECHIRNFRMETI